MHCVWRQPGMDLSMPRKLARLFRAAGTRLVHAHQCTPWFYAALARLRTGAPKLLLEEQAGSIPKFAIANARFVNRVLIRPLTHRFVAVSEDVRQRLEVFEGLDAAKIRVIYNGVTPPAESTPPRALAACAARVSRPTDFVVGTVGVSTRSRICRCWSGASQSRPAESTRARPAGRRRPRDGAHPRARGRARIEERIIAHGLSRRRARARAMHGFVRPVEFQRRHVDGAARGHVRGACLSL